MLDKNKLILVHYFGCEGMTRYKACIAAQEIKNMLINTFDDSVKVLVIPQRNSLENRLDFINVNNETIDEEKLSRFENAVQELQANINKFV